MPGVSISEYSPPSTALIFNYNSGNKGTDRVKQIKIIGESVFHKYLCGGKIIHSIYRVIKEFLNFYTYYHSAFFNTLLCTTESLSWNKSQQEGELSWEY